MINHTYHVLEYYKLLQILSGYASCQLGREECLSIKPSTDPNAIDIEQRLVSEMRLLLQLRAFSPLQDLVDIKPALMNICTDGACLEPEKLLQVYDTALAANSSKRAISTQKELCPLLYAKIKDTSDFKVIRNSISHSIGPDGLILDSASQRLKNLRREKSKLRNNLQKRLESIKRSIGNPKDAGDDLVSIRDGRYIIPIRSDFKNRITGIVHDYSRTHATCFIEPLEVVSDNNRLAEIRHLEKEEEFRILLELTSIVRDFNDELSNANTILGQLDCLYARARMSTDFNGVMPLISEESVIDLRRAMNPILLFMNLDSDLPVPLDIKLDESVNVLIISGPNRGGKTVALKTLGLLCLMTQAGMHIPAEEGSRIPIFHNILAEIGDDQDIQSGMSTFSAHISHIKQIIEKADEKSLIIIDEPGMGTDPDEGAALAMAFLDELSKKGSLIAVSTHHSRLKSYGLLKEWAKNASMVFDDETNSPTFLLQYGTPGTSYAFEVAGNCGIDEALLERARGYLDQDEVRLNRLINKLNQLKYEAELKGRELEIEKKNYLSAKDRMLKSIEKVESEKRELLENKRNEAELLISETREEINELINSLKHKKGRSQAFAQKRYGDITKNLINNIHVPDDRQGIVKKKDFYEGQVVQHRNLPMKGRIISLDTSGSKAVIMSGKVKLSANIDDLMESDDAPAVEPETVNNISHFPAEFVREINLIGYRVDDALPLIDRLIDRSMIEGDLSLRIIHGYGTGTLKNAIRNHLKKISCVKWFGGAEPKAGGEAITVVELH